MIYLFYGPDMFCSGRKVAEIKAKFLDKNPTGSGLAVVEVEKDKEAEIWTEIEKGLGSQGLFFSKQLLIIVNLALNAGAESKKEAFQKLKEIGNLAEDKDRVVIFWEKGEPRKNDKFWNYLLENGKSQRFDILRGRTLENWIREELKRTNPKVSLSPLAMEVLILFSGKDLSRLEMELEKLANFKESGELSKGDVEILVRAETDPNIFETVEALSKGEKAKALKLLHEQLEAGADPFYLLSMYVYQFRNLLKIGEFFYAGERNAQNIARLTGLHPFVVQKGMADLFGRDYDWVKRVFRELAILDAKLKRGEIDSILGLDKLIVSL